MSKEKQTLNEIWKEQRDTKDAVIALTKALVKIEGNEAKNPVFVQLSNGKREIDIEQLLKDIAQASGVKVVGGGLGGGVPSNPSAATTDQVADATTATEIVPANSARREVIIVNDSTAVMYVKFGTGASSSDYTARLEQYGYVQTEYTGVITALWASDAGGDCKVTEVI